MAARYSSVLPPSSPALLPSPAPAPASLAQATQTTATLAHTHFTGSSASAHLRRAKEAEKAAHTDMIHTASAATYAIWKQAKDALHHAQWVQDAKNNPRFRLQLSSLGGGAAPSAPLTTESSTVETPSLEKLAIEAQELREKLRLIRSDIDLAKKQTSAVQVLTNSSSSVAPPFSLWQRLNGLAFSEKETAVLQLFLDGKAHEETSRRYYNEKERPEIGDARCQKHISAMERSIVKAKNAMKKVEFASLPLPLATLVGSTPLSTFSLPSEALEVEIAANTQLFQDQRALLEEINLALEMDLQTVEERAPTSEIYLVEEGITIIHNKYSPCVATYVKTQGEYFEAVGNFVKFLKSSSATSTEYNVFFKEIIAEILDCQTPHALFLLLQIAETSGGRGGEAHRACISCLLENRGLPLDIRVQIERLALNFTPTKTLGNTLYQIFYPWVSYHTVMQPVLQTHPLREEFRDRLSDATAIYRAMENEVGRLSPSDKKALELTLATNCQSREAYNIARSMHAELLPRYPEVFPSYDTVMARFKHQKRQLAMQLAGTPRHG